MSDSLMLTPLMPVADGLVLGYAPLSELEIFKAFSRGSREN
jgi:hypothetical protein